MIVGNGTANHHVDLPPCRLLLILAVDILDLVQRTKRNMTRAPGLCWTLKDEFVDRLDVGVRVQRE